jgi:hypothetical protein
VSDKDDIFGYLRNRQKAAEIEAKVNGVNLWVLIGALGVILWTLLNSLESRPLVDINAIARSLLVAEALFLLTVLSSRVLNSRIDLRFSTDPIADMANPYLMLLMGLFLLLPPGLLTAFSGLSFSVVFLGIVGAGIATGSIAALSKLVLEQKPGGDRFPNAEFGPTPRRRTATDLVICGLVLAVFFEQVSWFASSDPPLDFGIGKQLCLIAAAYLLVAIAIDRKFESHSLAWTYQLETELILGSISPEVALRRIENKGLGRSLEDEMNKFLDDFDRRHLTLESLLKSCKGKLASVEEVPTDFPAERAARKRSATEEACNLLSALKSDCGELGKYLRKLEEQNVGQRRRVLAPIIASLIARHKTYDATLRDADARLQSMFSG